MPFYWFSKGLSGLSLGMKWIGGRDKLRGHWEEGWGAGRLESDTEEAGDACTLLKKGIAMW